jgi:hypothetical protein
MGCGASGQLACLPRSSTQKPGGSTGRSGNAGSVFNVLIAFSSSPVCKNSGARAPCGLVEDGRINVLSVCFSKGYHSIRG